MVPEEIFSMFIKEFYSCVHPGMNAMLHLINQFLLLYLSNGHLREIKSSLREVVAYNKFQIK